MSRSVRLDVIGGAYRETCAIPPVDGVFGSGLRAAAILRAVQPDVRLHTAIDEASAETLDAVLGALSLQAELDVTCVRRNEPVGFSYFTPLSAPAIFGRQSNMEPIRVDGDAVLVFRMVEDGDVRVKGEYVVLDPQQPRDLAELDLDWIDAEYLAIVANRSETLALGGRGGEDSSEETLIEAAKDVRERYGAEVVVVKRAAQGSLVVTAAEAEKVGVFPTERVFPIGTGDVFAAGFTWAWGKEGRDPVSSARVGSRVTAEWSRTRRLWIDPKFFTGGNDLVELQPHPVKVYLASPFFTLGESWVVELVRDALYELGADVFSPRHDVGEGGDEVAGQDLKGLENSQAVLALLDGNDPGTLFEVGWATARNTPIVGYCHRAHREGGKMLRGTGAELHSDLSTSVYRSIWVGMGASRV